MPPDFNRAQQRYLGLTTTRPTRADGEGDLIAVELHPHVAASLRNQLELPGLLRDGPLDGGRKRDTLQVVLAATAGYIWWLPGADPLAMDERYTLGWADCLSALYGS